MAGPRQTSKKNQEAFLAFAAQFAENVVNTTRLRMDEHSTTVMNSKAKKQELSEAIHRSFLEMFAGIVLRIEGNSIMRAPAGVDLPPWAPLSPGYLERKSKDPFNRARPSFFFLTGGLTADLMQMAESIPKIPPEHILVTRVYQTERFFFNKSTGSLKRIQKVMIDELGMATSAKQETPWTIKFLVPPSIWNHSEGVENRLFGAGTKSADKLLNIRYDFETKTKRQGVYRPLLGPYLQWFYDQELQNLIRSTYSTTRGRRK